MRAASLAAEEKLIELHQKAMRDGTPVLINLCRGRFKQEHACLSKSVLILVVTSPLP